VGIPYEYIATALTLQQVLLARGDTAQARQMSATARRLAAATGLDQRALASGGGDNP
jgi:hypothetical protein